MLVRFSRIRRCSGVSSSKPISVQFRSVRGCRGHDLAHGDGVLDLLQDEGREHGEDLQGDVVGELLEP
jgi:hypothetical protein